MPEGRFSLTKALNVAESALRTPRPINGQDIRSMPLNPREAFLLSRIDGTLTEADLCSLTGFDVATVSACLDRLVALGAIEMSDPEHAKEHVSQAQFNARDRLGGARVSQTQIRSPAEGRE